MTAATFAFRSTGAHGFAAAAQAVQKYLQREVWRLRWLASQMGGRELTQKELRALEAQSRMMADCNGFAVEESIENAFMRQDNGAEEERARASRREFEVLMALVTMGKRRSRSLICKDGLEEAGEESENTRKKPIRTLQMGRISLSLAV